MMNRTLLILCIFFAFPILAKSQDFGSYDKLPFQEAQTYLKKARFVEDSSYSSWDLVYQRMEWKVDPSEWYISGKVTSYFKPKTSDFSSLIFDLADSMIVDSIHYHGSTINFSHQSGQIIIQLTNSIPANTLDSISIWYKGAPVNEAGFGSFIATNTPGGDPILWTLSEPYGARVWWPCKQSLSDKIDSIEVKVTCPEGNKVASNGKLISEQTKDGETIVTWKHHYPIATYLVAIAVTNYEAFTDTLEFDDGQKMPILNYVYPSYLTTAKTNSSNILNIMKLYSSLVGKYPFADEKYGHAQFGWSGGMEHQTMSFMYHLGFSLVAHEMAHQWFGDCLTLNSWHDIWLNEGFATYMEGLAQEYLQDSTQWLNWRKGKQDYITQQSNGSVYVEDTANVSRIFDYRLSYTKGAYLLHMLRWELGDTAFFKGLQNYFNDAKVKYGFASQQDFVSHMEAAGDTSLTEFFNDWYYGQGYPIYQISPYTDYGDSGKYKLTISQTTSDPESVSFFPMHVPLRIWKDGTYQDLRLYQTSNPQTFELSEKPDYIQFDPDLWLISKNSIVTNTVELANQKLKIYPNPVSSELTVDLKSGEKILSLRITDMNGRILKKEESPASNKINVSNLARGIYFIQVKTDKTIYIQQFVKD